MAERGGEKAKNKGGRPAKSTEGTLTKTMAFRLRPALAQQIQASAKKEGRSMSEEVEARVVRSFFQDEIERQRFGGPEVAFLANLVASTASLIQLKTGKSCIQDQETYEAVKVAVAEIFDSSMTLLGGVSNVPAAQRRFDQLFFEELTTKAIMAASRATDDIKDIIDR